MKKPALIAAMTLLTVSLATLVWLAKTRGAAKRPADAPEIGADVIDQAAKSAQGLRVLAISMKPGTEPSGRIFQSDRGPEGLMPFPATPEPTSSLAPALAALASATAADFAPDKRLDPQTVRALQVFGVAIVVASDGERIVKPDVGERDPNVGFAPEVQGIRVRHVNPVLLYLAESQTVSSSDAIAFAHGLRIGDAQFQDDSYEGWGGAVTIDVAQPGEFLFPWPADGAHVTVDGGQAQFRAARVPLLVVKLPAGSHRVAVRYGDEAMARQWIAIVAAAALVGSMIALWLGLRPHPDAATEA